MHFITGVQMLLRCVRDSTTLLLVTHTCFLQEVLSRMNTLSLCFIITSGTYVLTYFLMLWVLLMRLPHQISSYALHLEMLMERWECKTFYFNWCYIFHHWVLCNFIRSKGACLSWVLSIKVIWREWVRIHMKEVRGNRYRGRPKAVLEGREGK